MERDKPASDTGQPRAARPDQDAVAQSDPALDAALDWLFTLEARPDDADLRADFDRWRAADPAHAAAFDQVAQAWHLPEMDMVAHSIRAAEQEKAPVAQIVTLPPRSRRIWPRVAGLAAAIALLAIGLQQYPMLMLRWQADYITAAGAQQQIDLPDGSRMVLNTDSAVALDFAGEDRAVRLLRGEAYFDVKHDPAHPFRVTGAHAEVVVKGTAFSVRTGKAEDSVVLERGHVEVARLPLRDRVAELEPGQSIHATPQDLSAVTPADPEAELAWLRGRLVFADRPLAGVLDEIGRYYGPAVVLANGALGQVRVSGSYRLEDPERVIRSLAAAAGGSVTRLPGGMLILR